MKKILNRAALLIAMFAGAGSNAFAEAVPGTNFDVHFESANIVGTGRSINIHRVPIYTNGNKTPAYYDATFKLSLDAAGNLVFDGFTKAVPSELNSNQNFIPGKYKDSKDHEFTVSGGGVSGGRVMWSITGTKDFGFEASWATGAPVGNPLIATLPVTAKLIEGQSYGVLGRNNALFCGEWCPGYVVGVSQSGKSITFTNYHHPNGLGNAVDTYVMTLVE